MRKRHTTSVPALVARMLPALLAIAWLAPGCQKEDEPDRARPAKRQAPAMPAPAAPEPVIPPVAVATQPAQPPLAVSQPSQPPLATSRASQPAPLTQPATQVAKVEPPKVQPPRVEPPKVEPPKPPVATAPAKSPLEKPRAALALKREEARKAQAYRDDFERWEEASRLETAAIEAFGKGDAESALKMIQDASARYEQMVKLSVPMQAARTHLAAARLAEAATGTTAALAIDPANASALQLQEEIRVASGQKEMQPEKSRVETLVSSVTTLSDAHGFAVLQQQLTRQLRGANSLYARNKFKEAAQEYKAISASCDRLKALDAARQATEAQRAQVEAARTKAAGLDAGRDAAAAWGKATTADEAGTAAQVKGDFETAKKEWTAALAAYEQASATATAMASARTQLAGKQFPAATAAAQAVATADPANEAAKALLSEIVVTKARDAATPLQSAAATAVSALSSIEDPQRFAELKAALRARLAAANALFARERFDEAGKEFQGVAAECERLKTLDTARKALATVRTAVQTQRTGAQTAKAPKAAPARWLAAEEMNAAAEAAFQKGDFDAAKTLWAAAGPAYEAANTAASNLSTARQQLAAAAFPAALTAVQAVLTADPKSEAAKVLADEIKIASDRAAALPLRTAAETDAKALSTLDDGQGFGAAKQAVWKQIRAAAALFDKNQFADASTVYKAVTAECARLKTQDAARTATATVRTAVLAKRQEVANADGRRVAPAAWLAADKSWAAGDEAFQAGDFEGAKKPWAAAQTQFEQIAKAVAACAQARTNLAAGQAAEAVKALEPAAAVDAASPVVKQLQEQARLAAARQGVAAKRSAAESAVDAVTAFDDAQGFLAPKAQVWKQLAAADVLLDDCAFEKAAAAYDAVTAECARLTKLDTARKAAATARAAVVTARQTAATGGAMGLASETWTKAEGVRIKADQAFEDGDFDAATKGWAGAAPLYAQVATDGAKVTQLRAAEQAWQAARGRIPARADAILAEKGGAKWKAIADLAGKGDEASLKQAAAGAPAVKAEVVAALVQQGTEAVKAKKGPDAAAACVAALTVDPGSAAAQAMMATIEGTAGLDAATAMRPQAEAAAGLAGLADANGFAAIKAAVTAQVTAGTNAIAQKQPGQAVAAYVNAIAESERAKLLDEKRKGIAKPQAAVVARKQEVQAAAAAQTAAAWCQRADQAATAAEQALANGDFDTAGSRLAEAALGYDIALASARATAKAKELLAAKKYAEAAAAALPGDLADPENGAPRQVWREAVVAARRAAAEPAKAAAEALAADVAKMENVPGLAAAKQALTQLVQTAGTTFANNTFEKAQRQYAQALADGAKIKRQEAARVVVAKLQEQVTAAKAKGTTAGVATDAPGLWQQAEAALSAAAAPYQSGDFEAATARLTEAGAAYEAATALAAVMKDARTKLAAKEFAAASKALAEASAVEPAGEPVKKLATDIRLAMGLEAIAPVRSQAEAAAKDIAALADAQGFAARKTEVQQLLTAAAESVTKNEFAEAAWKYEALAAACARAKAMDARRQDLARQKALLATRQAELKKAEADKAAPTLWQQAETANTAASTAFESGSFDDAAALWADAAAGYDQCGELATALKKALTPGTSTRPGDATEALRAVLTADPASAAATAALATIDLAVRKGACEPLQKKAAEALVAVTPLAETEGFTALKTAAQQLRTAAEAHFAANRFEEAAAGYEAVLAACEQMKEWDAQRKAAQPTKAKADAMWVKVTALADGYGWQSAKQRATALYQGAASAYEARRFEEAQAKYQVAMAAGDVLLARDGVRKDLDAVKTALDAQFTKAQGAALNSQAAEWWSLAESARTAGVTAYTRGDFETAGRQWAIAKERLEQGDSVVAMVRKAEASLAAGKLPEAWETIQAAREAGYDNALATQAETAIRYAIGRRDTETMRKRAEAAAAEAAKAPNGQGVAALQQEVQQRAAEAKQKFDANAYDEGARLLRDVVANAEVIRRIDERRALSLPLKEKVTAAVTLVNPMTDSHGFAAIKTEIRRLQSVAEGLYEQRQFDEADVSYQAALAECTRLTALDKAREEMSQLKAKLPAEQAKAAAAEVAKYAPDWWQKMEEAMKAGEEAFQKGDFDKARAAWEPLLKRYADAAVNIEAIKQLYEGVQMWTAAKADVPKEYMEQMERFGGEDWKTIKAAVAEAQTETLATADRIAAYKKAANLLPTVASKVEDSYRRMMCAQLIGEGKALLAEVPLRAPDRTPEQVAKAAKALEAATKALAFRPGDPDAKVLQDEARDLAAVLKTGSCLRTVKGQMGWILSMAADAGGDKAVTGGEDGSLRLWDVWRGVQGAGWEAHKGAIHAVAFIPGGQTVVSGGDDMTLKVSTVGQAKGIRTLTGHTGCVTSLALSADGKSVLSGSEDGTLRLWDLAAGESTRTVTGHAGAVNAVSLARDGKTAISGGLDKTVRVWDLSDGRCLKTFEGHTAAVMSVAMSPDGKFAVSGSADRTVRVWDVAGGQCLQTLTGHTASVDCVAFNADNVRVISGARDQTIRLWDITDGASLATLEGHGGWVRRVVFSPDGLTAISVDETMMKVWYIGKVDPARPKIVPKPSAP